MHAQEGILEREDGDQKSSMEMTPGQVLLQAGNGNALIRMDLNQLMLNRGVWKISLDEDSLRLGSLNAVQTGKARGCSLAKINDETVDVTSPSISLHASGARAIFEEQGAMIASERNTICVDPGGVSINGKQLKFDADKFIRWG